MLAPTDSALGLPVITNPRVPRLIRHALNVEGGLNDGLALPFVTTFLALALEEKGAVGGGHVLGVLLRAVVASGAIGVVLGTGGALALRWSMAKGWSARHWQSVALLAMAALAFVLADSIEGSGFIAAWVAGLAAGLVSRGSLAAAQQTPEELANLGISVSFVLFGVLFLAPVVRGPRMTGLSDGCRGELPGADCHTHRPVRHPKGPKGRAGYAGFVPVRCRPIRGRNRPVRAAYRSQAGPWTRCR